MNPLLVPAVFGEKRGKIIVFGILERQGKVYTEIVPDASKKPLQAVPRLSVTNLREAIALSTALNHSGHRLNGGLQNSRAFPDIRFIYHLKECEFRFHHREENLYDKIFPLLSESPL